MTGMYCFDCTLNDMSAPAVAICAVCGAGVCASCVCVGSQVIRHSEGFSAGSISATEVRKISCTPCGEALGAHHGRYHVRADGPRV